jgi:hypothetical protein
MDQAEGIAVAAHLFFVPVPEKGFQALRRLVGIKFLRMSKFQ